MFRLRKRKSLAMLLTLCMLFGMFNTEVFAESSLTVPEYQEADDGISSVSMDEPVMSVVTAASGSAIYVGGIGAKAGNEGTSDSPYFTLKEAADAINGKGPGSYQIIMQGDTFETAPITIGNFTDALNVSIAVSGSAIMVSKASSTFKITVNSKTILSLEGCSNTQQLVFDGGGDLYKGNGSLFDVSFGGTLSLNAYTCVQNNVNNTQNGGGIYNTGTLILNGGMVSNNAGFLYGGGINNNGNMIMEDGIVTNNKSDFGGGINNRGTLTMKGGMISGNRYSSGGGIYNTGSLLMDGGTIANHSGGSGSAIDNYIGTMTMNGGTITQNSDICFANTGSVIMNGGRITHNDGSVTIANNLNGSFHMKGGSISDNCNSEDINKFTAIYIGTGEFKLTGGYIENNSGGEIVSANRGSFIMGGGTIRNNTTTYEVVRVSDEGSFTMSDGVITNNTGYAINMQAPISLSDNASITGIGGEAATISINNDYKDNCINVSGSLSNITSIRIKPSLIRAGKQILAGTGLTEELISKFQLEATNYAIDAAGKLVYDGEPLTLYVDAAGSDDESSSGSSSDPLLTLKEAIDRIGTGQGTIMVQSDLDVYEALYIATDITIKSDGLSRTLYQKIPYSEYDSDDMFYVRSGKLTLGDKEQTAGELIIDNELNEISSLITSWNDSTVNLYDHAVIRNNYFEDGVIINEKSTFNLDGGSILNCRGNVITNDYEGTVNLIAGTISAATEDNDYSVGIINHDRSTVNMSGGTITGFAGMEAVGIDNDGNLNLTGGIISNNTYSIVNTGNITLSGNVSIPLGADSSNMVYLPDGDPIYMTSGLRLNEDNQIHILMDDYSISDSLLEGKAETIKQNFNKFIFADNRYGVSETGIIIYTGEPSVYYVDAGYLDGDSDGSIERPFTELSDAVDAIEDDILVGTIYICSDLEIPYTVYIDGDITILNYGEESHTITRSGSNAMFYVWDTLTLGSGGTGSDDNPSLLLWGVAKDGRTDASGLIFNYGTLNLYSGVKLYGSKCPDGSVGAIYNNGEFTMFGGVISDHSGRDSGGVFNTGTMTMEGGRISSCTGGMGGALYNGTSGTFIMIGGTIDHNASELGIGIYNMGSIHISEKASIPAVADGSNKVFLDMNSYIIIDADLRSSEQILLTTNTGYSGKRLLGGDENILINNYQKFILDTSLANYRLAADGTLVYTGVLSDYYVDQELGNDDNAGTLSEPFATLKKAVSSIDENGGVGTIHVCSDLILEETIIINGAITLLNEGEPHTISYSPDFEYILDYDLPDHIFYYSSSLFLILGQLELGNIEENGLPETMLLTMEGNEDPITGALISNFGSLILQNGIVMQNGNSYRYTSGIYNDGKLVMNGGVIQNNTSDENGGGIYNEGNLIMNGGVIQNNTSQNGGGICNAGSLIMNGGVIQNNTSQSGGGILNYYSDATIVGGSIRNNEAHNGGGIEVFRGTLTISGGNISGNKAVIGGGIRLYESDAIMSGGAISGNMILDEAEYDIGRGVFVDIYSTFTVLKDASITGGDDVLLLQYNDEDSEPLITVGDSLSEDTPVIMVTRRYRNDATMKVEPFYQLGDQIIVPRDGYTLTEQDVWKFTLRESIYVINKQGRLATFIDDNWFSLKDETPFYYTGSEIKPAVTGTNGKMVLIQDKDFQVSYKNNINAGTATVIIDGQGSYAGRLIKTFAIHKSTIHSILSSAPADRSISAAERMIPQQLLLSIPLRSVVVQCSHGTEDLPITWTLTEGTYDPKGGTYTFTGSLDANDNIETEGRTLSTRITVTPFILSKPSFENATVMVHTGGQVTARELGYEFFPTSGTIDVGYRSVSYYIAWDESTLDVSTVGASNTFSGIITYLSEPDWATLPTNLSVSRKVSVIERNAYTITASSGGNGSITPSGNVTVNRNAEQSFTIIPAAGYAILKVMVDGVNIGVVDRYTFRDVTENHTISVTFQKSEVTPTVTPKPTAMPTPTPTSTIAPRPTTEPVPSVVPTPKPTATPTQSPAISPAPSGTDTQREVEVSVKTEKALQNGELNISISVSADSIQNLLGMTGEGGQTVVTIPIVSEEIDGLMQDNSLTGVNIDIVIPDIIAENDAIADYQIQLDADIIKVAKEAEKDLHISVKDEEGKERYSWSFDGASLATSAKDVTDLDLSLKVEKAESHPELAELLGRDTREDQEERNDLVISFGHHGALPAQASVRIFVGDMGFAEGDKLYLYYYNSETGMLDTLPFSTNYQVDEEGYITVDIAHCSEYVLLPQQADAGIITSLRDQISLEQETYLLYLGSDEFSTATINIKLPETLEQVKSLKDKTSGSAIGAVVLTYQSGNPKVASVDSTGKIIAKKAGETVIKVTATLYSGKKKTFTIPVTVKKPTILPINSTEHMKVGESFTFTAEAFGLDAQNIEWSTTRKSIVVINKKTGRATAVKKGTDYVVASIGDITYQVKVIVK